MNLLIILISIVSANWLHYEISNNLVWEKFIISMGCEYHKIENGNNHSLINKVLEQIKNNDHKTTQVICAHTIKGAGVPFMENDNSWHYGSLTEEKYSEAINSITIK